MKEGKKDRTLPIKVSQEEWKLLLWGATQAAKPLSTWIRELALDRVRRQRGKL